VEALNRPPVGTGSARPDAVVLTHAHLDHTGRLLVEGAKQVTIFGETVAVNAQVHTLGGFSAHAGQTDLAAWFVTLAPSRPRVILTHGENGPRAALAGLIGRTHGLTPVLPALDDIIEA
jgi:metallo-beta-lactamase family protein